MRSASSSQRSFLKSIGSKNSCGSAVWMKTGMLRRAHASQTGSSSGSSTLSSEPSGFRVAKPEALGDLADADRARLDVGFELRDRFLGPAGPDVAEVDRRERPHAILVRRGRERLHHAFEVGARDAVGRDEELDVQLVERRHEAVESLGRAQTPAGVPVIVDDGKLGFRSWIRGRDQRVARTVVEMLGAGNSGAWHVPGRVIVMPGGHSWPAGTWTPRPRPPRPVCCCPPAVWPPCCCC